MKRLKRQISEPPSGLLDPSPRGCERNLTDVFNISDILKITLRTKTLRPLSNSTFFQISMARLIILDLFVLLVPHPLKQFCLTSGHFAPFHASLYSDWVAPVALVTAPCLPNRTGSDFSK